MGLSFRFSWRAGGFVAAAALSVPLALAQTHALQPQAQASASALDLSALLDMAWRAHPASQAADLRDAETRAKLARAQSWMAAAPTVGAGLRTDALVPSARREGLREIEFEIAVPLASPLRRQTQAVSVRAASAELDAAVALQRWRLAGDLREAVANLRFAESDLAQAEADRARSDTLAADTARRTRAGDVARVDELQARANAALAAGALLQAQAARDTAAFALAKLVGLPAAQAPRFALGKPEVEAATEAAPRDAWAEHPSWISAQRAADAARARLDEASKLSADAPSVSLQLANERTREGGSKSTARFGFTMPFDAAGSHHFRSPAAAQARRELGELEAQLTATQRALEAGARMAQAELAAARQRVAPAAERARLAGEAAALYEKAFRLGELDLPTRLRIESERAAAVRAAQRAALDVDRAVSRLNQALGVMP